MLDWLLDLRHAVRALARRPGFTLVAVLTLALGIGASTAAFAAVHRILLAPMPFADGERLGFPWLSSSTGMSIAPAAELVAAWRDGARTLEAIEAFEIAEFTTGGEGGAEVLRGGRIGPTLPATLGVRPLIGRTFVDEETRPGRDRVVLLQQGLWERRFGGRREAIGQTIELDGEPYTVVGVMPSRFATMDGMESDAQVWVPHVADTAATHVTALVKWREDASPAEVEAELAAIAARVPLRRPLPGEWKPRIMRPEDFLGDTLHDGLLVLFAAVGVVLLIACANVAGLLLARGEGRRREIAIRASLGAGRRRILRHLTLESLVLAIAGGALGVLVATWSLDIVRSMRPDELIALDAVHLNGVVLAFAIAVSLLTAAIAGLAPAVALARTDLSSPLKQTSGGSANVASTRMRSAIVAAQIALSVTLLVGAALLIRSMIRLQQSDLGFDPGGILVANIRLPERRYPTSESRAAFFRQLDEQVRALPAVRSATLASGVPPRVGVTFGELEIEGRPLPGDRSRAFAGAMVDEHYFSTLGIRVAEGRTFAAGETDGIVVTATTARKYWPQGGAVGSRVRLSAEGEFRPVVGIIEDIALGGPAGGLSREGMFFPTRLDWESHTLAVRARAGDPLALVPAIRAAVARIDPQLPLRDVATMESMLSESLARDRFNMALLSAFAAIALLLAAIGVYGLISYSVAQRTREIGIRIAIGAAPSSVRGLVLQHGVRLMIAGILLGSIASFWLVRLMTRLLHGMDHYDPFAFAGAAATIGAAALLATYLPARRACDVDPLTALRSE